MSHQVVADTCPIDPEGVSEAAERSPSSPTSVCVVGSGWQFTSGISYYTCRLTTALAVDGPTSALLMRRLVPRRWYPGRARVGVPLHDLRYPASVPVFDGLDWYWGASLVGAVRFLRRTRPEVIVLQWWTGAVLHSYLALAAVARSIGARLVIEFHEVQDTGEARIPGAARYLSALGARLVRQAEAIVVHSDFDAAEIEARFSLDHRPVRVIPHGPFDHHLSEETAVTGSRPAAPQTAASQAAVSLADTANRPLTILFFGTIRPYKGLEHLVTAFERLIESANTADDAGPMQSSPRLELFVVGEVWEGWTEPLRRIEASPYRDRIRLVNRYVSDDEVAGVFDQADVVALPYLRSSASGPLHIAMSHGLPIVVTDVGGLADGADGYEGISWCRPADVDDLVRALRRSLSQVGRRFADPRSWSDSARRYRELFAELGL